MTCWRISAVALACLAAAGCSYHFRITAVFRDGRLVFTAEREGLFARAPCADSLEIITRDVAPGAPSPYRSAWRIGQAAGGDKVCAPFPIAYGQVPAGLRQTVAPETLKPGIFYEIVGGNGEEDGFGSFRISTANPSAIERTD